MAQREQIARSARMHAKHTHKVGLGFSRELPSLECNQKKYGVHFPKKLQVLSLIEFKPCPKQKKTRIRMRKQSSDLGGDDLVAGFHIAPRAHDGLATASSTENLGPRILLDITDLSSASHLGVFLVDGAENWRDQIPGSRHR